MKPYRCPNPSCGTGTQRTQLGEKPTPDLLVIPSGAAVEHDGTVFWLVCPRCGRRVWWGGAVAQRIEAAAA